VISLWWDILKEAKVTSRSKTGGTVKDGDVSISFDEDCNKKLKELQKFLKSYSTKIFSVLKTTVEKINKNNPPTNKETRHDNIAGTEPLILKKEVGNHYRGMVEYQIGTRISRGTLSIYVFYEYKPISEESACKLIELFNSPESDDLNMNTDIKNNPNLYAHRTIGNSGLGYNAPRVWVSAGGYYPAIIKLGVMMDRGYYSEYDNEDEHMKEIYDAIRMLDACNKIKAILR